MEQCSARSRGSWRALRSARVHSTSIVRDASSTPSNSMISFMIIVLDMAWSYCLSVARLIRSTRVSPLIDRSFISVLGECL